MPVEKQNGEAHARVFQEIFNAVNEQHSDFDNDETLEGISVDFLGTEANGLTEPLGKEMACRVLRGSKMILATTLKMVFGYPHYILVIPVHVCLRITCKRNNLYKSGLQMLFSLSNNMVIEY